MVTKGDTRALDCSIFSGGVQQGQSSAETVGFRV